MSKALVLGFLLGLFACVSGPRSSSGGPRKLLAHGPPPSRVGVNAAWATSTSSPRWVASTPFPLPGCSAYEQGLTVAAEAIARQQLVGNPAPEGSELAMLLRAAGSPHVWPRLWILTGEAL